MSQTSLLFFLVREKTVSLVFRRKSKNKKGRRDEENCDVADSSRDTTGKPGRAEADCTTATSCWSDALRHASVRGAETSFFLALPHIWLTCCRCFFDERSSALKKNISTLRLATCSPHLSKRMQTDRCAVFSRDADHL